MTVDINSLNSKELTDLISQASKRRKVLATRKPIGQVRAAINRMVRTSGYTMEELFGTKAATTAKPRKATGSAKKASGKSGGKVPPKFRNPANPSETWSGRGKHPRWLAAYVAQGRDTSEFLINK